MLGESWTGEERESLNSCVAASDFFVAKNCHIATKKRSQATVQGNFLKKFQKNCHISRKLEELGRFLVFFF